MENSQGTAAPQSALAPTEAAPTAETQETVETQENQEVEALEGAEAQEEQSEKPETKAEKAKEAKNKKKWKLKVDGEEFDEEIDMDDEEYVRKQLQLAKVAQKRMQEYASLEKEVTKFVKELRENPKKALSNPNIGIDTKKLAASIIEEEIENSKKSPEQVAKEALEAELQALKAEREKEKEELRERELQRVQEQEYERYDTLMSKALESSQLPKSPYIIKKMADYMILGIQNGVDVSPEDVIPLVREEMQSDLKEMFAVLPDDVVEQLVGKEKLNSLRKKNLAKAKQNPPVPVKSAVKDVSKPAETKANTEPKKTFKDYFGV